MNNDLIHIFSTHAERLQMDDRELLAIVTHNNISDHEERHIHTLEHVSQGSLINYNDEYYLTISESINARNRKYKTSMQHCNYEVEIAGELREELLVDDDGNPIKDLYGSVQYIEIYEESSFCHVILQDKNFTVDGMQLLVEKSYVTLVSQNNEVNIEKFKLNENLKINDKNYKIRNISKSQKGLLNILCESNN